MRAITIVGMAIAFLLGTHTAGLSQTSVEDELAIIRVANAIDAAVDRKDWAKARGFFADQIRVDFTSLSGGEPATIKSDDLINGWTSNLGSRKTSFHLRGNHLVEVEGDRGTIYSHAYAWNRLEGQGDPLWEVWGHYTYDLIRTPAGWKVTSFTFVKTHERGNMWVRDTPAPDK